MAAEMYVFVCGNDIRLYYFVVVGIFTLLCLDADVVGNSFVRNVLPNRMDFPLNGHSQDCTVSIVQKKYL